MQTDSIKRWSQKVIRHTEIVKADIFMESIMFKKKPGKNSIKDILTIRLLKNDRFTPIYDRNDRFFLNSTRKGKKEDIYNKFHKILSFQSFQ